MQNAHAVETAHKSKAAPAGTASETTKTIHSEQSNSSAPGSPLQVDDNLASIIEAAKIEWKEIIELKDDVVESTEFPLDALGPHLAEVATFLSDAIQTPTAIAGQSLLAAASLAVQPFANIVIGSQVYPASNYFITVAKSGDRKSGMDKVVLKPAREVQRKLITAHRALPKITNKDGSIQNSDPLLLCAEPTIQGLSRLYKYQPSLGIFSDEGGRFLCGHAMKDDGRLSTATYLSNLHSGDVIDIVRGGDGSSLLYDRRLSMHLMIQPIMTAKLYGDAELEGQGFLARLLPAYPESIMGSRQTRNVIIEDEPCYQVYSSRMTNILEEPPILTPEGDLTFRSLTLSDKAMRLFEEYESATERRLVRDLYQVQTLAAKAPQHAARLAGILTLFANIHATEITREYMQSGIALAEYYLNQAMYLKCGVETKKPTSGPKQLIEWIAAKRVSEIALTEIYQKSPSRGKATAQAHLSILADHGFVQRKPGSKPEIWWVNPRLFSKTLATV